MKALSVKVLITFLFVIHFESIIVCQQWPAGRYGLPKPKLGCPSTRGFTWQTGWRYQDTEDLSANNQHSANFHLDASVSKSNLKRHFCIKTDVGSDRGRPAWPPGQYCIYRKGNTCPPGFKSGWIRWDDEDLGNRNKYGGTLPDGKYDKNTVIYFCCRSDGRKPVPITLPFATPFFLIAQGSASCQQVKFALSQTEWIRFDTEDIGNNDGYGGSYPYGAGLNDHTMHYCYYVSCAYKLSGSHSNTITSPNYPRPYANGQLCSWQITVPAGLQINLVFTLFLLQSGSDADMVQIFDGSNSSAPSLGVFSGLRKPDPSGITSTSNKMFVLFKSDSSNANKGFTANYNSGIFTTSRPSPPTATASTNSPTTTATPSTLSSTTTSSTTISTTTKTSSSSSTKESGVTTTPVTQSTTIVTTENITTPKNNGTSMPNITEAPPPTEVTKPSRSPTEEPVTTVTPSEGTRVTTEEPVTAVTPSEDTHVTTEEPTGSSGTHAYNKADKSSGSNAVTISVPVVVMVIILALVLLFFLVYRRRRKDGKDGEQDKNHLVFFTSDGRSHHGEVSIDNPVYDVAPMKSPSENGVNGFVYPSHEDYITNPFAETTNPLYDSAGANDTIPDVYAVPERDNVSVPTMHLNMNDDVTAYENQLYDTRMLGVDQSNESSA